MKQDKKIIFWAIAMFLVISLLPMLSPAAAAATTVSIQDVTVLPGGSATIPIMITDVTDVGVAAIEFSFNPSVVHVTAVTDSQFDVCDPTINNVSGEFEIAGVQFWSSGLNGNVRLANVTLKAVGAAGQSSPLNLTINELKTVGPPSQNIPADVDDGTFTITGVAAPYLVTYTISNHTITPPQTTEIDVEFSESVNYRIAIEKDSATIYDWTGTAKNPSARIWDGTYEINGTQVPDGDYSVNVTGLNTTTGLSVMNNTEIITVTSAPLLDTTPPTTEVTRPPDITPIPSGTELPWTNKDVVISFRHTDNGGGTGVDYTNYSKISETGPWTTVNATTAIGPDTGNVSDITDETFNVTVSDEGITKIYYYSVDKNETPNVEDTKNLTVRIDKINPVVTDPNANPGSIPADGTTTSQLNVTVTDNIGVASVTVNLSALGGSATQVMTNILGTNIYRATTTAAVGTAPDTYLVNVNATDGAGNYNDTVSIELEVTPAAAAATTISIQDITVPPGGSATIPIMITNVTDVGVAAIEFSFNPSVVHVTAVTDSQFDVCDPTIDNVTGEFEIAGVQFWSSGLNGNVRLANVTLKAVGTVGQSSPLNLTINELTTVGPPSQNIPADVDNGTFTIKPAAPTTTISIQDVTVPPGGSATIPIMIINVTDVGVAAIEFSFNPSVVHVTAVTDSQFDVCDPTIDNVTGEFEIAGVQFWSSGLNGNVRLANVTLKAVGAAGQSSPLNLTINELTTVGPPSQNIPADVMNGTFTITEVADNESPVVTDPNANPGSIPADGTTTSQLNVTVTDNIGVASVTVNLSALGGSATQVMTNILGTNIYRATTTAAVGTAPDTYLVNVNATDGAGNYNDTVSIELEVGVTPRPTFEMELSPGWHLISIPWYIDPSGVQVIRETQGLNFSICEYNATTGLWTTPEKLQPLHGYWINMYEAGTIVFTKSIEPLQVPPSRLLTEDWNLIGPSFGDEDPLEEGLSATQVLASLTKDGFTSFSHLIVYNETTGMYTTYTAVRWEDVEAWNLILRPGQGCWIGMREEDTLLGRL
jgi:adhesin/invasin